MSKKFCELFGVSSDPTTPPEHRVYYQRPGKRNPDGSILYFTQQHHKHECDVNNIVKKYDKTGLLTHMTQIEAKFGDCTGLEFTTMQNKIAEAHNMFNSLPSEIRKKFENDPAKLLHYMEDENNRDEAIELGLIKAEWLPEEDGLGEHVVRDTPDSEPKEK